MKRLVSKLKRYTRLYRLFWEFGFSTAVIYRTSSLVLLLGIILVLCLTLVFFQLIYRRISTLGGWRYEELLVLMGFFYTSWTFFSMMVRKNLEETVEKIQSGQFDFAILRPMNSLILTSFFPFRFDALSALPVGLFTFFLGLSKCGWQFKPLPFIFFLLTAGGGLVILYAVSVMVTSLAFWTGRAKNIANTVQELWLYGQYPDDIFQGVVRIVLVTILPIIFFAAVPVKILLGKAAFLDFWYLWILSPVFLVLSFSVWKAGLRRYQSAGG